MTDTQLQPVLESVASVPRQLDSASGRNNFLTSLLTRLSPFAVRVVLSAMRISKDEPIKIQASVRGARQQMFYWPRDGQCEVLALILRSEKHRVDATCARRKMEKSLETRRIYCLPATITCHI